MKYKPNHVLQNRQDRYTPSKLIFFRGIRWSLGKFLREKS